MRKIRLLAVVLWLGAASWNPAAGSPFSPDDSYGPACGSLITGAPLGGWKLWSSRDTWQGGAVPGVGAGAGANVTVECGIGIILDLPSVQLTLLDIKGALTFLDSPSLPTVNLTAAFIIVQGRLIIGTPTAQFSQKAVITLVPNPNNRAEYLFSSRAPADLGNPRSLGHKALVVVGGQVDLHGLPGPAGMLTWTKLGAHANANDASLVVRGDVSQWPVGSLVVVAPTDFKADQEDVGAITSIAPLGNGLFRIGLSTPLRFNHFGDPLGIPDEFGGFIDETAEVALLSRNIVITGAEELAPNHLEGGHFMVYMTNTQQLIEGVQFLLMGQQGKLGRYPIHFHLCGDQGSAESLVRKNVVLHSKQRGITIHGTSNAYIDSNTAYNVSGHCFLVEEGSETGNTFINNLGIRTRAVTVLISSSMSDNTPATFWVTNPNNNYISNNAAGSDGAGFWLELGRFGLSGISATWAKFKNVVPVYVSALGTFSGNTAHSSNLGLQFYNNGYYPRVHPSKSKYFKRNPVLVTFSTFSLWKNSRIGAQLHNMDHVRFDGCTFADNPQGVHFQEAQGLSITGSRFVGQSSNYGNPKNCNSRRGAGTCAAVTGCRFPLAAGALGRSVAYGTGNQSLWGVVFTENRLQESGSIANLISQTTFAGYDATCHPAAALALGSNRADYWNTGTAVSQLKFDPVTHPVFFYPWLFTDANGWLANGGEVTKSFALHDLDGSLVGNPRGGYIVANAPSLLPPSPSSCSFDAGSNAWACPQTCYRTVQITFTEPAYTHYGRVPNINRIADGPRKLGDYAYLTITRVADNTVYSLEGNLREYTARNNPNPKNLRIFAFSLLAGHTYNVQYTAGAASPSFVPSQVAVSFNDGPGCGQGLTLRFLGATSGTAAPYSWSIQSNSGFNWTPCSSGASATTAAAAQFQAVCTPASTQALESQLSVALPSAVRLLVSSSRTAPAPCSVAGNCGVLTDMPTAPII